MEPGTIEQVIFAIGQQAQAAIAALVPVGHDLALSFIVLSTLMLGASMVTSGLSALTPQIIGYVGAAAGTLYVIDFWPQITMGALHSARLAIGLVIPGYQGPTGLFTMATDISGRLLHQSVAVQWTAPLATAMAFATAGIMPIILWVGLSLTGLLAVLAELELVIGAMVAPLILPALAFGFTRPLGFGAVRFLVQAAVRVVVMGFTAHVLAATVTQVIMVGGEGTSLTHEQVLQLFGVSILALLVGVSMNGLANSLVGGGAGVMGLGAPARAAGMGMMAARAAGAGGAAAMSAGAAGLAKAAGPAGSMVGGGARMAKAAVRAVRSGSAFK